MNMLLSTARVSAFLFVLFSAFTIFHSPPASALISIICMGNPETGIVTCTAKDEGGGGGECDVTICGGGGPGGGGGNGGGGTNASESRAESIAKRILKNSCVKTKSGEDCGAFGVRLEGQCFLETGLTQVSRFCANFGNDAAIACSNGQIPSCP